MSKQHQSDTILRELLTGQREPQSADLRFRLALGGLRQSVRQEPSSLDAAVGEIFSHYSMSDFVGPTQVLTQSTPVTRNLLLTAKETSDLVESGEIAIIAGAEEMLASLPPGNWIGGTTAYLMTAEDHVPTPDHLICSVLGTGVGFRIAVLGEDNLCHVTDGRYKSGFTYLLLPAFSEVHYKYALEAPGYPYLFDQPMIGWVTGVHISDIGKRTPKVFDGRTGVAYKNAAVALHIELSPGFAASLDMISPFIQGDGPAIIFPETAFIGGVCTIEGKQTNFATYVVEDNIDISVPLVANYAGAPVNVSVRAVDAAREEVHFYAPVVAGESYRFAKRRADFTRCINACVRSFEQPENALACSCILNYLYSGPDSVHTAGFVCPVTFGEIAYILLNQTLVVLNIKALVSS